MTALAEALAAALKRRELLDEAAEADGGCHPAATAECERDIRTAEAALARERAADRAS